MPDKLIEEGLKQPDRIKISFKKRLKDITRHVEPDQAQFGLEYFLAFKLWEFKLKILTRLSEAKKENGPTLFDLMLGQCFQDIPRLLVSNALMMPTSQRRNSMSVLGTTLRQLLGSQILVTNQFVGFVLPRSLHSCQCMKSWGIKCSSLATLIEAISIK
jgi:hypothetical protein